MKYKVHLFPSRISAEVPAESERNIAAIVKGLQVSYDLADKQSLRGWNYNLTLFLREYVLSSSDRMSCIDALTQWIFFAPNENVSLQSKLLPNLITLIKKAPTEEASDIKKLVKWRVYYNELMKTIQQPSENTNAKINGHKMVYLQQLVKHARVYFTSTTNGQNVIEEIMYEFIPKLCPHDYANLIKFQTLFALFLPPVDVTDHEQVQSVEKLLGIIEKAWEWIGSNDLWEYQWFSILKRIAKAVWKQRGPTLWNDQFLEKIFTKILSMLDVSVATNRSMTKLKQSLNISSLLADSHVKSTKLFTMVAKFVVYSISEASMSADLLLRLLELVRSYYHPSNGGTWTPKLASILSCVAAALEKRKTEEQKLQAELLPDVALQRITKALFDISQQAIRSKDSHMKESGALALRSLLWLNPSFSQTLIPSVSSTLESSTSPLQAISCINVLSKICFLVLPNNRSEFTDYFDDNMTSLLQLLQLVLPGIDPNDSDKTRNTLAFFTNFATLASREALHSNQYHQLYHEWSFLFMQKLLTYVKELAKEDLKSMQWKIRDCLLAVASAWNEETLVACLQMVTEFISSHTCNTAKKQFGMILRVMAQQSSDSIIEKPVNVLVTSLASNDGKFVEEASKTKLEWNLRLLAGLLEGLSAEQIENLKTQLSDIVRTALGDSSSKEVFKGGLKVLEAIFHRTSFFYIIPDKNSKVIGTMETIQPHWYEPGAQLSFPYELLDSYLQLSQSKLNQVLETSTVQVEEASELTERQQLERTLLLLHSLTSHAGILLRNTTEHPSDLVIPQEGFPSVIINRYSIGKHFDDSTYARREKIASMLLQISSLVGSSSPLLSASISEQLSSVIHTFLQEGTSVQHITGKEFSYNTQKKILTCPLYPEGATNEEKQLPVSLLMQRVSFQIIRRMQAQNLYICTNDVHEKLIQVQYKLSLNEYIVVRRKAQSCFTREYTYLFAMQEKLAAQVLNNTFGVDAGSDVNQLKGNLYIISSNTVMNIITTNWKLQSSLMLGILKISALFQRPSIQKLIYSICTSFSALFYFPMPIKTTTVKAPQFALATEFASAKNQHEIQSKENVSAFEDATRCLLAFPNTISWRDQVIRNNFLCTMHKRRDIPLDPRVLSLFMAALSSDISILRTFARNAIPSIIDLYYTQQLTEIYENWPGALLPSSTNTDNKDPKTAPHPLDGGVFEVIKRFWTDEEWLGRVLVYFAEDHHIRTEEEEAKGLQGFDLSKLPTQLARIASHLLGASMTIEGGVPSDTLHILATNLQPQLLWPYSNDHKFLSYLFDTKNAKFFSTIFSVFARMELSADEFNSLLAPWVSHTTSQYSSDDRKQQIAVAEMVSGSMQALLHSPESKIFTELWEKVFLPIWTSIISGETGFGLDWPTALRYALSGQSPSKYLERVLPLFYSCGILDTSHNQLPVLQKAKTSSSKLVRSLQCLRSCAIEANWALNAKNSATPLSQYLLDACISHSSYPSSLIRVELAQIMSLMLSVTEQKFPHIPDVSDDNEQLSKQRDTILLSLSNLFSSQNTAHFGEVLGGEETGKILSYVLASLKDESNFVQQVARSCLALIAQSQFPCASVRSLIDLLEKNMKATDWHLRRAVLPVIQLLDFNHRFIMTADDHKRVHEICIKLLVDVQVEVRELASISLSSVLRGWDTEYIKELASRFTKASRVPLTENQGKRFVMRHGGVLGLCALLRMFPYDFPDFIVPVIMEIVEHNEDPTVISSTVRTAIKDFWRTHQELWHIYKVEVLSAEQATILQELLVSPSYYA